MPDPPLFLKTHPLPKKYRAAVSRESIDWAEFVFRSRKMPNGYWVTLAVIVIPELGCYVVAGSACSPDDAHVFDRIDAANRALGRARQLAIQYMAGWTEPIPETLAGRATECVRPFDGMDLSAATLKQWIEPLYKRVAANAERAALKKLERRLQRAHPDFRICGLTETRHEN